MKQQLGEHMTFLDLFSGIGGFRRGLERSRHTCVGHVEIDKYANISYMAMYGLIPCKFGVNQEAGTCRICKSEVSHDCDGGTCKGEWFAEDIKQIRTGEIPKAEIWTFGFPCTDISLAGKREGLRGGRSGLFFTVISLLKSTPAKDKPRKVIVENVKHLVSSERGGAFTTVLTELWESGYDAEWQVVNSKDFGVPQNRERVYIVGYLRGERVRKVFPISGANGETLKEIIGGCQWERVYDSHGLSVTLTTQGGGAGGRTGLYLLESKNPEQLMKSLKNCESVKQSLRVVGTELDNAKEKNSGVICRPQLTAELSDIQYPFKFMAVSRPVDISPLIHDLQFMLKSADDKRKELLRQEILQMSGFALSGEITERQFYISIWEKCDEDVGADFGSGAAEKDIYKRASLLAEKFTGNGIGCDILMEKEIVRLLNLVNNPSCTHLEDTEYEAGIPLLKEDLEK